MDRNKDTVIFIGDSRRMKGGVSTVIKTLEKSHLWKKRKCYWLETQINSSSKLLKTFYFIRGFIKGLFIIPQYHIVHFQTAPGSSMITLLPIFIYTLLCKKKIIVQLHMGNQIKDHVKDWSFSFWTSHANRVIFLGQTWQDKITPYLKENIKTDFLYNPVISQDKQLIHKKYFLYAAFFSANKGYDILLKAFSHIIKDYPEWKLIMCGSGDISGVTSCINKYHLNNHIILPGWIEGKEKEQYFREAYAYCMTSYQEGLPMSVLESISYGIPIITTPVGCLPEILKNNETCLFFNFGNADELEKKMRQLITDYELRNKLRDNSYELSKKYFSIEAIASKLDKIYDSL